MGQLIIYGNSLDNLQLHNDRFFHVMHDSCLRNILQNVYFLIFEAIHPDSFIGLRSIPDHFDSFQQLIFYLETIEIY